MAAFAGRRLMDMAENTTGVLAVEYLAAAQGLDFRAPLKASAAIETAKATLRQYVRFYDKDRYFAPDIAEAAAIISEGELNDLMISGVLPSFD
jgi:histidine ammonia-lyase